MARMFLALLRSLGHEVRPISALRSLDPDGSSSAQDLIALAACREIKRIEGALNRPGAWRPDLFFTYHNYHKAPDYLGPAICGSLGIPYVIAEASIARKQREGPWAMGYRQAESAIRAADCVLAMTRRDLSGLEAAGIARHLVLFPPFLDTAPFRRARLHRAASRAGLARDHEIDEGSVWLACVAMMRKDVKLSSYQALAEALGKLACGDWTLLVAGDGPARPDVEEALETSGIAGRVRLLGLQDDASLHHLLAAADIYTWPGMNEAYGMALLEAQASGLPALSFAEGGVVDIIVDGQTGILVEDRSTGAFANALERLIKDGQLRRAMGDAALQVTSERHDIGAARRRLGEELDRLAPGSAA